MSLRLFFSANGVEFGSFRSVSITFILLEKLVTINQLLVSILFAKFLQKMDARVREILYYKRRVASERRDSLWQG
ncbi:hypothetical protein J2Z65_005531 [Paenibacillus aceris]|uniref:Uncharacterized protein n=1 Tax=Paenibacillus aceris TaxID=869555 RepID=A0ABS4I5S9_9BACL|nr:hypothetical protein [Paenibacillus aceris]